MARPGKSAGWVVHDNERGGGEFSEDEFKRVLSHTADDIQEEQKQQELDIYSEEWNLQYLKREKEYEFQRKLNKIFFGNNNKNYKKMKVEKYYGQNQNNNKK